MTHHLTKPIRAIHFIVLASLLTLLSPAVAQGFTVTTLTELKSLAETGDSSAQLSLGLMYEFGQGVLQDYAEAVKWYRLAAEQGEVDAQFNLGGLYESGQGVLQDYKEAVKWWRLAAEQGEAMAQTNLGYMYHYGQGVLQDNTLAHMGYNIGSANGNELGGTNRDKISKEMTPAAIEKAQAMARECMNSGYTKCGY